MNEVLEFVARLYRNSEDFVCLASLRCEPMYINPAGRQMAGISRDQKASSFKLQDFFNDDTWEDFRQFALPMLKDGGQWTSEGQLLRRTRAPSDNTVDTLEVEIGAVLHIGVVLPVEAPAGLLAVDHRPAQTADVVAVVGVEGGEVVGVVETE